MRALERIDQERARLMHRRAELEAQVQGIDKHIGEATSTSASSVLDGDARTATKQRAAIPELRAEREVLVTAIEQADARLITLADERALAALEDARARYSEAESAACEAVEALHQVVMDCAADIVPIAQAAFRATDDAAHAGGNLRRAGEEPPIPPAYERHGEGWAKYPVLAQLARLLRNYAKSPTEA
jgi:chromosome segregation ATPase